MLPILRIIPVGGVLLAIAILILALDPPVGPHAHVTAAMTPARGPLIAREQHPEWRQFLLLAAFRRADELSKLRDLPDAPMRTAPLVRHELMQPAKPAADKPPEKVAGVHPGTTDGGDITGSTSPDAVIPVDIGESSSAELPVIPHKEMPPAIMMPAREMPADEGTAPVATQPKPESQAAPQPAAAKQATRAGAPQPDPVPVVAKPAGKAATPEPAPAKQASREPAPKVEIIKAAAPAPVTVKQASRTPAPVTVKQTSRTHAPEPAAKPESKAAAPPPAPSKLASREVVLPPPRPKPETRHAARHRAKPRHELRVARRARRVKTKQEFKDFDLFRALFGVQPQSHYWRVESTAPR